MSDCLSVISILLKAHLPTLTLKFYMGYMLTLHGNTGELEIILSYLVNLPTLEHDVRVY